MNKCIDSSGEFRKNRKKKKRDNQKAGGKLATVVALEGVRDYLFVAR